MGGAGRSEHLPLLAGHRAGRADRQTGEQSRRIAILDGVADSVLDALAQRIEAAPGCGEPPIGADGHHRRTAIDVVAQCSAGGIEPTGIANHRQRIDPQNQPPALTDPGHWTGRIAPGHLQSQTALQRLRRPDLHLGLEAERPALRRRQGVDRHLGNHPLAAQARRPTLGEAVPGHGSRDRCRKQQEPGRRPPSAAAMVHPYQESARPQQSPEQQQQRYGHDQRRGACPWPREHGCRTEKRGKTCRTRDAQPAVGPSLRCTLVRHATHALRPATPTPAGVAAHGAPRRTVLTEGPPGLKAPSWRVRAETREVGDRQRWRPM